MTKRLTIACENLTDHVRLLERDYDLCYPEFRMAGGKAEVNFDIYLRFDSGETDFTAVLPWLGIPSLGTPRYSKPLQMQILGSLGIGTPRTVARFQRPAAIDVQRGADLAALIPDDMNKFVVKINNGARGLGQLLTDRDGLYDAVTAADSVQPSEDFQQAVSHLVTGNQKFVNPGDEGALLNGLRNRDFHISEFVTAREEYRVVGFYDTPAIVVKRTIDPQGWQANASVTGFGEVVEDVPKALQDIADKLCKALHTPWLSIDVYRDDAGRLGVFEFQMQMGYQKLPKLEFARRQCQGVAKLLKADGVRGSSRRRCSHTPRA